MASDKEQMLVNVFWAVAGEGWQGVLANLLGLPIGEDADPVTTTVKSGGSSSSSSGGASGTWSKVANYASFGIAPLARAVFGLFTGGNDEEPAPLVKFALPASVNFESAVAGRTSLRSVDYDQFGMPRVSEGARGRGGEGAISGIDSRVQAWTDASEAGTETPRRGGSVRGGRDGVLFDEPVAGSEYPVAERRELAGWANGRFGEGRSQVESVPPDGRVVERIPVTQAAAPQVTIQVQAMDSRSFLDHSTEIARAVREAMLNMHSLNDVVSEL
jgi:hypothetical protein